MLTGGNQPQQIYIGVEAHEMVVVDEDVKSGHSSFVTPTHMPRALDEKGSRDDGAFDSDVERGL